MENIYDALWLLILLPIGWEPIGSYLLIVNS